MSQKVTFHFLADLPHQSRAIQSTVALFEGIRRNQHGLYGRGSLFMGEAKNPQLTIGTRLLEQVRQTQLANGIFMDDILTPAVRSSSIISHPPPPPGLRRRCLWTAKTQH